MNAAPSELELVLVGGGHAHLAVLRRLAMAPWPGVRVTLVTREVHTPYSGMLPGHVAGHYAVDDMHVDLGPLAARGGLRLIHGELTGLDPVARQLELRDRPPLRWDLLSLDTGSTPSLDAIEGDVDRLIPVKPISAFLPRFEALLERLRTADSPRTVAVIGAGAGGVELVLALVERLRREGLDERVEPILLTASTTILPAATAAVRDRFEDALAEARVRVERDARLVAVESGSEGEGLVLAGGRRVLADEALLVTEASAPDWARASTLDVDERGFLAVGPTLQSTNCETVFAAGDLAALTHAPRPKSGVYAVRAGPVLAHNLEAWIRGRRLRTFRPQRRAMYLLSTGPREAVLLRPPWPALAGPWVWRWKDAIDRRFMRRFQALPPMDDAPPPSIVAAARGGGALEPGMRCTGCGSKIDSDTLGAALSAFGQGPATFEDAAALPVEGARLVQTTDGFPLPLPDLWLSGRIAVIHALGDLHAMGARPVGALALATLPWAAPALLRDDLAQLMAGVRRALDEDDCALLGGHSTEGAQAALGLTLTGHVPADVPALTKGGGRAGDVLVLTKALGTGAILAGTADGRLPSRRRYDAVPHLLHSNRDAVAVLRDHDTRGCTDVTGYGLLGHALEMADASGTGLSLDADAPVDLGGALEAIAAGVVSSLQRANESVLARASLDDAGLVDGRVRLLCDPQTCGGLLAALPAARAADCIEALVAAGYRDTRLVGRLTPAGEGVRIELSHGA